ncbi:MAG: DUF4422 domain-containing protein [Synergistaceae bacterium]|nr:DUF4422 domain-containing protein [Synergistaceae bacterium]
MPPNDDGILLPIQVGRSLTDMDLHMQSDNEVNGQSCDNISDKNASYNEMTAVYWAWKNLKKLYPDVKYVGLFHYRRFLAFDERKCFDPFILKLESEIKDYKINSAKIIKILESGKVILSKPHVFAFSVAMQYFSFGYSENYRMTKDVIREKFQDYYDAFIEVMEKNNKLHAYNVFIMKYEDFVKYCEWVFAVLEIIEPEIQKNLTAFQRRLFMSERLLHVYVHKHKMKIKSFNMYFYGDKSEPPANILKRLRRCWSYCKVELALWILRFSPSGLLKRLFKR